MSTMNHVFHLAETIGPRGSTTPEEAEAARYSARVLEEAGVEPVTESFTSAPSAWYPYALFAGLLLVSEVLYVAGGRWGAVAALVVALAALASVLLELTFRPNPLRWLLPKGPSQNVWGRLPSAGEEREQVVLMGHLDSHRTPLAFSTDRWLKLYRTLVPVALVSSLLLTALFAVGIATTGWLWRALSAPFGLITLGLLLITLQADRTPYTAGANDNASGAAIVLSTAERLKREPLRHTAVWAVLSGCEEVGCYGAEAFARTHANELGRAVWIVLDNVSGIGADPAYLTSETFLLTYPSHPDLLATADRLTDRHPELGAVRHAFAGAYTEGAIGVNYGHRVLTFLGVREDGALPEWHRPTDVVENVDPAVVERTETFLWHLLQEIDGQAGQAMGG